MRHLLRERLIALLAFSVTASGLFVSCLADDDYTTSESARLTFQTDTVAFDTLLSGEASSTMVFTLHNPSSKAIRLPRVELDGGGESVFRVNVDGAYMEQGVATDLEIGARDSLICFLSCLAPYADSDEPVTYTDALTFTLASGVRQSVVLTATALDVETLRGLVVSGEQTLSSPRPYRVLDSLVVAEGAVLTLTAGTRMFFHSDAALTVRGTLQAVGTLDAPITLRGDRTGNMFQGQAYDRIPGQWQGMRLTETSYANRLEYVDLHSSVYGIKVDSSDVSRDKLYMYNCRISNTSGTALRSRMANIYVVGTEITNAGANCVMLQGGDATFVHCTIARFYPFIGAEGGVALDFCNFDGTTALPLTRADFINTLITGAQEDEIMGSHHEDESVPFEYFFHHCLMRTPEYEDERLANCLFDDDETCQGRQHFPKFNSKTLEYPFTLAEESPARDRADASFSVLVAPEDRNGVARNADGMPDIGAYELIPTEKNDE